MFERATTSWSFHRSYSGSRRTDGTPKDFVYQTVKKTAIKMNGASIPISECRFRAPQPALLQQICVFQSWREHVYLERYF
jgi:hypothetical protein